MKYRSLQNIGILVVVAIFVALAFVGSPGNAQTRSRGKATPTPKKKATPTPKRAKAKPTPTPKKNAKTTSKKTTAKAKPTPTPKKNAKATAKTTSKTDKKTSARNTKPKTTKDTKSSTKKTTTAASKTPSRNSRTTTPVKTTTVKTRPKTTRPAVVNSDSPQIIVSSFSASLRSAPSSTASELSRAQLGSVYNVVEKRSGWYKVQLPNQKTGWIPVAAALASEKNGNDEIYKQLLAKNTASAKMDFTESVELYEFLSRVQPEIKDPNTAADFGLKRLVALRSALKAIPAGQSNQKVYRDFIKAQDENIVYSDPTAEWYVRAPLFWELHSKYTTTSSGERIAWEGAKNPLPGECEGYVNCHIFLLRMTDGEYLNFYPSSGRSAEALRNIINFLEPIAADAEAKKIYNGPTDVSDRAEFNSLITELRVIISRLPNTEKERALQQLRKIAEGFK